jgi:hypothetical protein
MDEAATTHLEFIQNIINRMSNNSFLIKGWSITVTSAILALEVSNPQPLFAVIALFSSLSFWGLDAYYLRQERLFRCLYNEVRQVAKTAKNKNIEPFSLSTAAYNSKTPGWFRTLWSKSIIGLHGVVIAVVIITMITLVVSP